MAEPETRYDVFIVHSTDDAEKARRIDEALQKWGYVTCAHYRESNFNIGKSVFDNILSCVERSDISLILVTENSIVSKSWVTFEILMALEKSHRTKKMGLRLVMEGLSKQQRDTFKTGELEFLPDILLDFNMADWEEELATRLKDHVAMTDILPTGNVSHGLVFNYFIGYLRLLLPVFKNTVMNSEVYKTHPEITYPRFVILLPKSCATPKIESHGSFTVKKEGCVDIQVGSGDKLRMFKPVMYSIEQGGKKYYFLGEFPNILSTISKLESLDFLDAGLDVRMQSANFRIKLDQLVNHRENSICNDAATLILYDDTDGSTSAAGVIWDKLQTELPFTSICKTPEPEDEDAAEPKIKRQMGITDKASLSATIISYDLPSDSSVAEAVKNFLTDKDISFPNDDGQILQKARWNIFVLSRESMNDSIMKLQFESAVAQCLNDDQVQVIPILVDGTDISELPPDVKWITVLKQNNKDYLQTLWDTMQGGDVKMAERIQAGDVSIGLAWTYLLNYLPIALLGTTKSGRGFRQRFEDAISKYKPGCPCVPRLFVIIPKSCSFPAPGEAIPGEESLGPMEPIHDGFRPYGMNFYRVTLKTGEKCCYAREYATPIVAMYEMCHKYPFAGLHTAEMHQQSGEFADQLRSIVANADFKVKVGDLVDRVCFVQFDDDKEAMTDALEREIALCAKETI